MKIFEGVRPASGLGGIVATRLLQPPSCSKLAPNFGGKLGGCKPRATTPVRTNRLQPGPTALRSSMVWSLWIEGADAGCAGCACCDLYCLQIARQIPPRGGGFQMEMELSVSTRAVEAWFNIETPSPVCTLASPRLLSSRREPLKTDYMYK